MAGPRCAYPPQGRVPPLVLLVGGASQSQTRPRLPGAGRFAADASLCVLGVGLPGPPGGGGRGVPRMAGSGGPVFLPVPDLGLTPTLPHHGLGGGLPGRKAGALHVGCPRPPTVAAPSAPLPHVEQYEVVWPQRLPGPRARRALSPQAVSLAWKLVGDGASLPGPAERAGGRLMPPVCPAACEGPVWGLRARRASVLVRGPLGRAPLEAPFPPPGLSFLRPPPPPAGRAPGAATPADHGCPRTASWDPRRPGHSPVSLRFLLRLARGGSAGPVAPFAGASWDFPELPGASLTPTECARVPWGRPHTGKGRTVQTVPGVGQAGW